MVKKNINLRFRREKAIVKRLGLAPVPYSGAIKNLGSQDGFSELFLAQIKSTRASSYTVKYEDLISLLSDKSSIQTPLFVIDFAEPKVGACQMPETQWVCLPLEDFLKLKEEASDKNGTDLGRV